MKAPAFLLCGLLLATLSHGTCSGRNLHLQTPDDERPVSASASLRRIQASLLYPPSLLNCRQCTQVFFVDNGTEIVVNMGKNGIYHRSSPTDAFSRIHCNLNHPHAITYVSEIKTYFLCDTDNNRIIALSSLENPEIVREINSLAGIPLQRPHDIVYAGGYLYTLNPYPAILFRFSPDKEEAEALDLSQELQYSRALSVVDGNIFVSGSSVGKVVEIIDFSSGIYHIYRSPQKKRVAPSGTWQDTGLVINDVARFRGFWYATSYFCPSAASAGADYNQNKLIRFKNWPDFTSGNWQDLGHLLPDGYVPYYLTVKKKDNSGRDGLAVAVFSHENPGRSDGIFLLTQDNRGLTGALSPLFIP